MPSLTDFFGSRLRLHVSRIMETSLLLATAFLLAHCAGSGPSQSTQTVRISNKDLVVLEPFRLPDSAQATLETYGWDTTRFVEEWRKELHFQLRRAGIATSDDSSKSAVRLRITVHTLLRDGGPQIAAQASLIKPEGSRSFSVPGKSAGRTGTEERMDPTLDRLRYWSSLITKECLRNPKAEEKRKQEYVPQLFMVF
jgi:hypothetical protein